MIIENIYAPEVYGEYSAEDIIFRRGTGDLFDELRTVIFSTHLAITDTPRRTNNNKTMLKGLPQALNKAIGLALSSLGWQPRQAPGAASPKSASDWAKFHPSGLKFMGDVGLAVEIQFGQHYQFNADVQRFAEAILEGKIVAGVSVVASDRLEQYKADRTACFSDAVEKLDRWLGIWAASGAILLPSIMIIAVGYDELIESTVPQYKVKAPIYDLEKTDDRLEPVRHEEFLGPQADEDEAETIEIEPEVPST